MANSSATKQRATPALTGGKSPQSRSSSPKAALIPVAQQAKMSLEELAQAILDRRARPGIAQIRRLAEAAIASPEDPAPGNDVPPPAPAKKPKKPRKKAAATDSSGKKKKGKKKSSKTKLPKIPKTKK